MFKTAPILLLASVCFAADPAEILKRIRNNDVEWLKVEAKSPDFLKTADNRKNTPLILAAGQGSLEAVKVLIDAGANVNDANSLGITPLIASATEPEKVKLLLAKGADAKAKSQIDQNALIIAAGSPRATESVRMLIAAGVPVNARGARGTTALLSAVGASCAESNARLLMTAGADVTATDGAGFGAAHGVASCSIDLIREFIAKGANVNATNKFGGEVKKGLIALRDLTPLMLASAHREPAMVKLLLDSGAKIDAQDCRKMTALHFAVSSEDQKPETVKLLLAKGADPKVQDIYGEDSIAWARKFNDPAVLALLGVKPAPVVAATPAAAKGPGTQAALTLLEQSNENFFKESGCGGCHHSVLTSVAGSYGKAAGLKVNDGLIQARSMRVKGMLGSFGPTLQQLIGPPGDIDTSLFTLMEAKGLGLEHSQETEILSRYLMARQMPDGRFTMRGVSRSPVEESDIHRTALAVWLLPAYSDAAAREAFAPRLKEAVKYLETQPAHTTDEMAMKILGLKWGGGSPAVIAKTAKALEAAQLADGSFAGNKHLGGDVYSTGVSIFALREGAGRKADQSHIAKAAAWLRSTQREDASWYQKSRAPKFQPYFESGFPHGHDQWISSAATAWAVIALSQAR